jgi:flagellar biosynthesis protein FliR
MITFTYAQLSSLIAAFMWPLARIAALVATAPVLGNLTIPRRVRMLLAVAITLALAPAFGEPPTIDPWSGAGLLVLAQQMLIGAAMGLAMRVVFTMVDFAGEVSGLQMGLGFATFFDPQHTASLPVIAEFLSLLATLTFLAVNGHLLLIAALADSFRVLPVGDLALASSTWFQLADWGGKIFVTGIMLALPIIATLLITNLALGVLSRAAPQLNLFAVGFPITLLAGWVILGLSLPHFAPTLTRVFDDGLGMMAQVVLSAAGK